jgi:hypothetical protein
MGVSRVGILSWPPSLSGKFAIGLARPEDPNFDVYYRKSLLPRLEEMTQTIYYREIENSSRRLWNGVLHWVLHFLAAGILPLLFGIVVLGLINGRGPFFDSPYSPILLGFGCLLGFVVNNYFEHSTATWVWIGGVVVLAAAISGSWKSHNPAWCGDCTKLQDIWERYFSTHYGVVSDEGLGKGLITTPVLSTITYSLGAAMARWKKRSRTPVER